MSLARFLLVGLPAVVLAQTPTFGVNAQLVEVAVVARGRKYSTAIFGPKP